MVGPGYEVEFRPEAQRDLTALDKRAAQLVLDRIKWVAEHFEEIAPEPLRGRALRGVFKLRAGAYRILYTVSRQRRVLSVHRVGHRKEIYRAR